ncbi:hypothetical protein B0H14DRAFT_2631474 [Mycena olivaceomarginata]|nr:hypothetical protein B0H14DRAFT_2631474 [Mycena olivaceomarginata]
MPVTGDCTPRPRALSWAGCRIGRAGHVLQKVERALLLHEQDLGAFELGRHERNRVRGGVSCVGDAGAHLAEPIANGVHGLRSGTADEPPQVIVALSFDDRRQQGTRPGGKVAGCYRRGRIRGGEDVLGEREVEVYTIKRMGDGVGIEAFKRPSDRVEAQGAGQHVGVELGGVGLIVRYTGSRAGEVCIASLALVVINPKDTPAEKKEMGWSTHSSSELPDQMHRHWRIYKDNAGITIGLGSPSSGHISLGSLPLLVLLCSLSPASPAGIGVAEDGVLLDRLTSIPGPDGLFVKFGDYESYLRFKCGSQNPSLSISNRGDSNPAGQFAKPGGDERYWLIDVGFAPADYAAGKTHKRLRNELNPAFTLRQFATLPQYLKGSRRSIPPTMTRRQPLPDTNLQSRATGEPPREMAWGREKAGISVGSFGLTRHMIVQWIQKSRTTRNPLSGPKIVAQPQIIMVAGGSRNNGNRRELRQMTTSYCSPDRQQLLRCLPGNSPKNPTLQDMLRTEIYSTLGQDGAGSIVYDRMPFLNTFIKTSGQIDTYVRRSSFEYYMNQTVQTHLLRSNPNLDYQVLYLKTDTYMQGPYRPSSRMGEISGLEWKNFTLNSHDRSYDPCGFRKPYATTNRTWNGKSASMEVLSVNETSLRRRNSASLPIAGLRWRSIVIGLGGGLSGRATGADIEKVERIMYNTSGSSILPI